MYMLAHDLGTSGNKATLSDESGLLIASRTAAYPTDCASGNRAEQNPRHWWKAIVDITQALPELASPNNIAGVALSGQMMGCLCIDKDGNPFRPHTFYCDQRSQEEEAKLTGKIDPLHFYEITGHRISASYSVERLMWVKKHESEIFAQTAKILNAKDYINYHLCGTIAADPPDASGTNAYDLNRWQWSEEIIEAAELDLSLFPEVRSSINVIGEIINEAAREAGLLVGTPVICGGGDGSCAGVGAGCVAPGTAYNYLGSSSWVALTVEKPIVDEQRRTMSWAHVVPGILHPSGTMQAAGSSCNWMINQLCQNEQALAAQSGRSVFELIDEQIIAPPIGANKLLFLPYTLDERTLRWNVDVKEAFIGLTLGHKHGDMLRAVMEGVALNLGFIINIFRKHALIDRMTVIGGCAQNPVWRQMMADIYQTEIHVPNYLEEVTSTGVAILVGIGAGVFPDFSVIDRFVRIRQTVQPIPKNVKRYEAWMPIFDQAYHALCEMYTEIVETEL